ncbi:Plasmodium exported protein, unknown function [Plasmodium sp. gorilla clade G2]|uniref:Plasmodium exported protein, unknown function n=1 Tax=Plasmodium sp. gorilla clade G2 TaxID=880535 RepID=UPI000D202468|nr:Plasmodium exported protein, unknown function [Plasmodium sp. gorilla clade G2]SOV13349.1 Plasmodium exported protein, unknown function [Plasmodium sp. gorilla clade G2]
MFFGFFKLSICLTLIYTSLNYTKYKYYTFCDPYKTQCKGKIKNNRTLTTSENIKPSNKKLFKKYVIQGERKKKEYEQDLFVIDCSGLDTLLKNDSHNTTNQIKKKMFKEYEEMYSQLYGPKKKKKKKNYNIFKKILKLLHCLYPKHINRLLRLVMTRFITIPLTVFIILLIGLLTGCSGVIPPNFVTTSYISIGICYLMVPLFALLLHLKYSQSY